MEDEVSSLRQEGSSSLAEGASSRKRGRVSCDGSDVEDAGDDALTQEELENADTTAAAAAPLAESFKKPRNAFHELMAPKPKPTTTTKLPPPSSRFTGRDGLGAYLTNPTAPHWAPGTIIFHTPSFVAIHDAYPKATVHCLLLPRDATKSRQHPFDALADPPFLASVRAAAARLRDIVASELQRLLGPFSRGDAARNAVLAGATDAGEGGLPRGRDWAREIMVGVHAVPSMNHLHVHVLSRDMHSDRVKGRKHYNSFTTGFFVPLDAFPLAEDDERRRQGKWPERPMVCWRCGRDFGGRFAELKAHLEVEFDEWKRE